MKKGFSIILGIFIGLLVIGGGVYFYLNTDKDNGSEVAVDDFNKWDTDDSNTDDNSLTNYETDRNTALNNEEDDNWETYTNGNFDFSVSLPTPYRVEEVDDEYGNKGVQVHYSGDFMYVRLNPVGKYGNNIDEWFFRQINNYSNEEITLGGQRALKYYIPAYGEGGEQFSEQVVLVSEYNDYVYQLEFQSTKELSDIQRQIIESFQFLDTATHNIAPEITILTPNGGEVLERGNEYILSWSYKGLDKGDNINIGFRPSDDMSKVCWIESVNVGIGSINITPEIVKCDGSVNNLETGGEYKVQLIVEKYRDGMGVTDMSDDFFIIK